MTARPAPPARRPARQGEHYLSLNRAERRSARLIAGTRGKIPIIPLHHVVLEWHSVQPRPGVLLAGQRMRKLRAGPSPSRSSFRAGKAVPARSSVALHLERWAVGDPIAITSHCTTFGRRAT